MYEVIVMEERTVVADDGVSCTCGNKLTGQNILARTFVQQICPNGLGDAAYFEKAFNSSRRQWLLFANLNLKY